MRKIKFRGKRLNSNQWTYGDLRQTANTASILFWDTKGYNAGYGIDRETVGQYTGKNAKNDKQIYEGDILKDFAGDVGYVIWNDKSACFTVVGCNDYGDFSDNLGKDCVPTDVWFEVIGNIYDNPELIKESD